MPVASVSVVIPCHNERDSVLSCLGSLAANSVEIRTVLVDDGSTDGVGSAVATQFPDVRLVTGDGELWWSGAINAGLRLAQRSPSDFYLLLNNDCVLTEGVIDRLVASAQASERTIVSATIYDPVDGSVVSFGGRFGASGPEYILAAPPTDAAGLFTVDWLPGHCLLVPTAVFDAIGLIDESAFPHYWADADFTLRARRAGYRLAVHPEIRVFNDRSQTGMRLVDQPNLKSLLRVLTSRRSWLRVDENVKFWWRHRKLVSARSMLARYSSTSVVIARVIADRLHIRPAVRWLVHRFHPAGQRKS